MQETTSESRSVRPIDTTIRITNRYDVVDNHKRCKPRQKFGCIVVVIVLLVTILQLTMTPSHPPLHTLDISSTSSLTASNSTNRTVPRRIQIKPSESIPPKPIELFDTNNDESILLRHKCLAAIRLRHDEFYKSVFPKTTRRVLLVDPAYHNNVGDTMLVLGEREFLKRMGLDPPLECGYAQAGSFAPRCSDAFFKNLSHYPVGLALWQAGGNWGDLWRTIHRQRVFSFEKLLRQNITVISMPQSLHYNSKRLARTDAATIRKGVVEGTGVKMETPIINPIVPKRVVFAWREHESAKRGKQLYPYVNNVVVPDMAFQLGPYKAMPPKNRNQTVDFLLFLRKDKESRIGRLFRNSTRIDEMLRKLGKPNLTYTIVDWQDRLTIFQSEDMFFTDTAVQLLSLGRVVICDRLHASILAYLSGLPFVYIDQKTQKITKALRVAFESSKEACQDETKARWTKAISLEQGIQKGIEFLDRYNLTKDGSGQ